MLCAEVERTHIRGALPPRRRIRHRPRLRGVPQELLSRRQRPGQNIERYYIRLDSLEHVARVWIEPGHLTS